MTIRAGRVLVIEDDKTLRETLEEVMADDGYEVRMAANGFEALEWLEAWQPDVVILDLMMPTMDAYEFRKRQLEAGACISAGIVVLSAARDLEAAAQRLHADAWLAKPFGLDAVSEAVEQLVRDRVA